MPYDVFISFKNSGADGKLTKESRTAKKLYDFLTAKGLRVFFSNVELEFTGKAQYTKVIDEALDSSQFLIAVGSSHDNLNSQWVRYEWESFLNDIRSGIKPNAEVFVLCDGVNIPSLPRALRQQQAFNANDSTSFDKLYNFIKNAGSSGSTAPKKPDIPPVNKKTPSNTLSHRLPKWVIPGASAVLVALVILVVALTNKGVFLSSSNAPSASQSPEQTTPPTSALASSIPDDGNSSMQELEQDDGNSSTQELEPDGPAKDTSPSLPYWENTTVTIPDNAEIFIPLGTAEIQLNNGERITAVGNTLQYFYDFWNFDNSRTNGLYRERVESHEVMKDGVMTSVSMENSLSEAEKIPFADMSAIYRKDIPEGSSENLDYTINMEVTTLNGETVSIWATSYEGVPSWRKSGRFVFLEAGAGYRWVNAADVRSVSFDWDTTPAVSGGVLINHTDGSLPLVTLAGTMLMYESNNTPAWIDLSTDFVAGGKLVTFTNISKCVLEEIITGERAFMKGGKDFRVSFVLKSGQELEETFLTGYGQYREIYAMTNDGLVEIEYKSLDTIIALD